MQRVASELLAVLRRKPGVTLHELVMRSTWSRTHFRILPFLFTCYVRLRKLIKNRDLDAVLFSSMVTGTLTIPLRSLLKHYGIRTGVIVHGLDVTTPLGVYQRVVRRVFRSADVILPVSKATGDACVERGLNPDRLCVIHNGVDTERFPEPGTRLQMRAEMLAEFKIDSHTMPGDAFIVCSVGRHVKRKGFAWFIRNVMPSLPENVHYWLVGEGPERSEIARSVREKMLTERVHLLGKISDVQLQALYRGADLFVMPNISVPGDMEGFGIVMLEAGLNGLPSVAAEIEGIREVIKEGKNGVFVASGDSTGFVTAITRFLEDSDLLEETREHAFRYTKHTFGWDTVADQYIRACSRHTLEAMTRESNS